MKRKGSTTINFIVQIILDRQTKRASFLHKNSTSQGPSTFNTSIYKVFLLPSFLELLGKMSVRCRLKESFFPVSTVSYLTPSPSTVKSRLP